MDLNLSDCHNPKQETGFKGFESKNTPKEEMDGLAVLLVLVPLSAQVTPVIQREAQFSPVASVRAMEKETRSPLSGSLIPSVSPSIEPPEEDEWAPVEAYLYNANATLLAQANCSRAYRLPGLQGVPVGLHPYLSPALDALTNAANFLNMIFQANDLRESSVTEDIEWYHAFVRGLLEGNPLIRRALLTFDAQPAASRPQLVLRASRTSSRSEDILLQDLSSAWELMHPPPPAPDASWFTALKFPELPQQAPSLSKRLLLNDLSTLTTPKWGRGDSYVTNQDGVRWADAPFLECEGGRFVPDWLLTLSTSFFGLKPDLSPEFRGVIRVDVSLQSFDLDQCAKGKDWFSNTHQCNRTSMQCEPTKGQGFQLGQYRCLCKEGYYRPTTAYQDTRHSASGLHAPVLPVCLPCWPGCLRCVDGSPCMVQEDWFLRATVLTAQGFIMSLVFISMLVAYQFRRDKRIRASGLLLLETILFGSVLLYFPVFILYFKPSTFRCILLRWVRLLGFAIMYGTLILKMYRLLKVFLSHTTQRVPCMSNMRLLRLLGIIVLMVSWFLSAWTAGALQNSDRNIPLLITATTSEGQSFTLCDLDRWDYMMALAEVLFLCWGSVLCGAVKTVPSAFHEPRYMSIAIHNELLLSSFFHLIRFSLPSLHPDWMLLLVFIHTHVTATMTLVLLFIPKFLHVSQPLREEVSAEVYEDEVDLHCSGSYLNSSFTSAWSEHSLDPDDIRDELKKLYSQLEVHKTKKMITNNPHLQKKRTSRKAIGHSVMKRITSQIPESMSRQCSSKNKEGSLIVGGGSHSGSFNKKVSESSSIKFKEESKQHGFSIHKPQSTFNYVKDNQLCSTDTTDPSVLESLMRRSLSKKTSIHSVTESVDNLPLVYKSASAHNLSADIKFQLEPNKLQKSLSVMTRNNMSTFLSTRNISRSENTSQCSRQNLCDRDHSEYNATIRAQATNYLLSGSFDKEVSPWELEDHPPENKSLKHVTYALFQDSDKRCPEKVLLPSSLQSQISPRSPFLHDPPRNNATWAGEEMQKDESKKGGPHRSEESDSDSDSKPKVPMSSSAPTSPITVQMRPKEDQVLSCYGPPRSFSLSVKGLVMFGRVSAKKKNKNGSGQNEKSVSLSTVPKMKPVPMKRDSKEQAHILMTNKSPLQKRSVTNDRPREMDGIKPCLVKQAAIRVSSNESQETDTTNQKSMLGDSYICPQEKLESEKIRQNNSHSNILGEIGGHPSNDNNCMITGSESTIAKTSKNTPGQKPPTQISVNTEVCPKTVKESTISPVKKVTARSASVGIRDIVAILRQRSAQANICPWEVQEQEMTTNTLTSERSNICPWESEEPKKLTSSQQSVYADICPWETQGQPPNQDNKDKKDRMTQLTVLMTTKKLKEKNPPSQSAVQAEEVCPWDVPDPCKQSARRQQSIVEEVCPWDIPDPCKQSTQRQQSIVEEVCPWDVPDPCKQPTQRQQSIVEEVCPWEVPSPYKQTPQRQQSIVADVCPWDVPDPCKQSTQRQQSIVADVCPWDVADACQQAPHIHQNATGDVCHLDVEDQEKTKRKPLTSQDSEFANICPWETQDNSLSKDAQGRAECNVKPAITTATKLHLARQMPSKKSVTSGEHSSEVLESSQTASKICQDSKADVCPWDLEESRETTKRQKSLHTDICPWETQDIPNEGSQKEVMDFKHTPITPLKISGDHILPKDSNMKAWNINKSSQHTQSEQHSIIAEVCPWDVQESNLCQEKQSTIRLNDAEKKKHSLQSGQENTCPSESEETTTTKRQESVTSKQLNNNIDVCQPQALPSMADICPWETGHINPCLIKQAAIKLSSEEAEPTSNQGHIQEMGKRNVLAEVCPWETEESKKMTEKREHMYTEVCPWEAQSPEKTGVECSVRTDVCPWEGEEQEKVKKQEHVNVCPWEIEEVRSEPAVAPTTKQSSDREITSGTTNQGEICQGEKDKEINTARDETGTQAQEPAKKEGNSNQLIASISEKTDGVKSNLRLSSPGEPCPRVMQEVKPPLHDKENNNLEIPPWECEDTLDDNDAESAAEAFFFPPDL